MYSEETIEKLKQGYEKGEKARNLCGLIFLLTFCFIVMVSFTS